MSVHRWHVRPADMLYPPESARYQLAVVSSDGMALVGNAPAQLCAVAFAKHHDTCTPHGSRGVV